MPELNNAKFAFDNAIKLLNDNNLKESVEQLNEIIKIEPNHIKSLNLLGDIYIKLNKPKESLHFVNKILNIEKFNKLNLEKKYKLLLFLGNESSSHETLELLHKKHPSINTARELSNYYLKIDDEEKSDNVIQDFFESDKTYSELYKGIRHVKAGRFKLAEEAYKKVLKKDKNNIDALRLLGLLAFKNKNYTIAENLFIKAIKIDQHFHLLWDNLAKVYRIQNKLDKSKKAFQNLIKLDPYNLEALIALGTIYVKLADYDAGINTYKEVLKLKNSNPRVYLSMGHALKTIGKRKECEDAYHRAIELFHLCGEGYWSLANLKTYEFSDKQIFKMENSLEDKIHEQEKIQMLFALGKAYESRKNYKKSFKYYEKGNWMQRKLVDYNAHENSNNIDSIISFFDENYDNINFSSGFDTDEPIFILGLPRAGSTLLEQILSAHSKVEGTQELHNIMTIGRRIKSINNADNYLNNLLNLDESKLRMYGKMYIDETKWARREKVLFIDKMPNNFPHIGLIKMILPNAKIIDARRNPMDGCFSCFKQYFAKGQHFTYDLDDIARYYKDYVRLMNFWNEYFPNDIHTVIYEDVINNPEDEVRKMLNYLNLPFEKACMDFYKSSRPVKTASSEQVRQPIYKSALNYWKNFEEDLSTLSNHFNE